MYICISTGRIFYKVSRREIELRADGTACCLAVRQYLRPVKLDRNVGKDCRMNMDPV